jgi:hypothetical protein
MQHPDKQQSSAIPRTDSCSSPAAAALTNQISTSDTQLLSLLLPSCHQAGDCTISDMPCLTQWYIWPSHTEVGRTLVLSPSTYKQLAIVKGRPLLPHKAAPHLPPLPRHNCKPGGWQAACRLECYRIQLRPVFKWTAHSERRGSYSACARVANWPTSFTTEAPMDHAAHMILTRVLHQLPSGYCSNQKCPLESLPVCIFERPT